MAAIAGMRDSDDAGTGERPKNFRELILWRDPNGSAPLTALMSKMRKETTDDPEFNWWEEEQNSIRVQVAAQYANTTTAVTFTLDATEDFAGNDLVPGDLCLVEQAEATTYSFEIVEIGTITSNTQVIVTRAAAGTSVVTITTDSYLLKIGSAFEEGSTSPDASTRNPTKYLNYTQIFKTTYNLTNTARKTRHRTGDLVKNDKKRKAFDHAVAMEWAALFGHPNETTGANGHPKRYTGGLYYFLGLNYDATSKPTIATLNSSTATEEDFLDATYGMWDFNVPESGDERIAFCGNGFLNKLNKIAKADGATRVNYDDVVDVFGMRLQRWILPQGTIYLKSHPLMNNNSFWTNGCFMINPPGVRYRPLQGRDTKFQDNIQANDADQVKGQWIGECGFEFNHLRSMRYLSFR